MTEWDIGLAKMFKDRDNIQNTGVIIGKVIKPLPELEISILSGSAILDKDNLYICNSLLNTYTRECVEEGIIQFNSGNCGATTTTSDGGQGASPHKHNIEILDINNEYKTTGTIIFTDTLKADDEVLLVPSTDEQIFFIIDKVKKVGEL